MQTLPITYLCDSPQLITVSCVGTVTVEEQVQIVSQMIAEKTPPPLASILVDVCLVTYTHDSEDLRIIVFLISRLQARFQANIAILSTATGLVTLSHIIAISCKGSVRAFQSEQAARLWLLV
jgi:hypothetical protein